MIPIFHLSRDAQRIEALLGTLRLNPIDFLSSSSHAESVRKIVESVAKAGDEAIVSISRQFDDPNFTAPRIRVTESEMEEASKRIPSDQRDAIRRSISQVREYQSHIL